jgi:RHS repeat-associated protein
MSTMDIGFDAQVPSLPKGGGSIGGLGATFTPDLSTGTGTFVIPLDTPNGPNDIGPRLMLRYDTGSGNGPFGLGFSLPMPRILISTSHGYPLYDGQDALILEGAGELLRLGSDKYRLKVDGGAWRVEAHGDGFRLTDREGIYYYLGITPESRISGTPPDASQGTRHNFAWHLERIEDPLGNAIIFKWMHDGEQLYLGSLAYGPYEVQFHYHPRADPIRYGRAGFLITTTLLCQAIELHLPGDQQPLLRRWTLHYKQDSSNGCSLLEKIILSGYDSNGKELSTPALCLRYSGFENRELVRFTNTDNLVAPGPISQTGNRVELIDWNGYGLPDLLEIESGGRTRLWPNMGDCLWGYPQTVADLPLFSSQESATLLLDMDGDGVADLVQIDRRVDGYIPHHLNGKFGRPVTWRYAPDAVIGEHNARLVDLDGDGIPDLISCSGNFLYLYYRSENDGWAEHLQRVPNKQILDANLADPHIFLADMTGDGTSDIVRVDGGGITYCPYLGYGRWSGSVHMENPPQLPRRMNPERLFLCDIDGDGCDDLIYLDQGKVLYWINQGGNRFGDVNVVDNLPWLETDQVRVADMRGNGCSGLLWSAKGPFGRGTVYYYLDFSGNSKPYLLTNIDNGVGAVTSISYSTSARKAAEDSRARQKWSTFIPVVVPVVSKIVTVESSTGQTSTTVYRYHNGRYDGILREFAGFGQTEEFKLGDVTSPTLRTVTWFHNGIEPENPIEALSIEARHQLRTLRGRIYRQERYGQDGSPLENLPYDRLEQKWNAVPESTAGGIVYLPRLSQTIRSTFEREPTALATITTSNISWDKHGNITETKETSSAIDDPSQQQTLRTIFRFASDPTERFISHQWRVQQFDKNEMLIADTITEYDGVLEGQIGAMGLITKRSALVLGDELVTEVYGPDIPDFAALGYYRRQGENGWWIDQVAYQRMEDASGMHGRITGPRGAVTVFDFDVYKIYPIRITDPADNALTSDHDYRNCRTKRITDASGSTYLATFDSLARPVAQIQPGDSEEFPTSAYVHVADHLPTEMITRMRAISGNSQTIDTRDILDGFGRLIERRVADDLGEIAAESYLYSNRGMLAKSYMERRPTSISYIRPDDTLPHSTFYYDALGRLIKNQNPDGSFRTIRYSSLLIEEADEEDNRTDYKAIHANTPTRRQLDPTGRVRSISQNLNGKWLTSIYEYDIKGKLLSHTDAAGNIVHFWYDYLSKVVRVDRPENKTISVYDPSGNLVEGRDNAGSRILRTFDACNRPIEMRYDGDNPTVRFTYHDNGAPAPSDAGLHTAGGHCVRVDDDGGTTIFDYDERGRAILKRSIIAGTDQKYDLSFDFRSDDQLLRITYPESGNGRREVEYQYDIRGKLAKIPTVVDKIDYDLAGRRTRMLFANGVEQTFDYEPLRPRLKTMQLTATGNKLRSTSYAWDLVGNLLQIYSLDVKLSSTFVYDDLYRLISAENDAGESRQYSYDIVGNLVHKSDVGSYTYGENGAPNTCLTTAGDKSFTYTPAGQMQNTPWGKLIFDPVGRLASITNPDGKLLFAYNYAGVRVSERGSGYISPIDRLTPDPLYALESGKLILNITDGRGIIARQQEDAIHFLHSDHLGSLVIITDTHGQQIGMRRYDPYGAIIEQEGLNYISQGYTGGVSDHWSGLLYLNARYYHPSIGRFISPDSLVQDMLSPIAWNSYAYCRDNPLVYIDPTGHGFWGIFLGAIGIAALVTLMILCPPSLGVAIGIGLGAAAGGTIGGLAAASKGGSFWDILTGVLVGAAVGGWAAYASLTAGAAFANTVGLSESPFWSTVVAGSVNGAINGAGTGFTVGYAGGLGSFGDVMKGFFAGALAGAVTGAILGSLTAVPAQPKSADTLLDPLRQAGEKLQSTNPLDWISAINTTYQNEISALKDYALSQITPYVTNTALQPIIVDTVVGAWSLGEGRNLIEDVGKGLFLEQVGGPLVSLVVNPIANKLLGGSDTPGGSEKSPS